MDKTMTNFTDTFDELLIEVLLSTGGTSSSTTRGVKPR